MSSFLFLDMKRLVFVVLCIIFADTARGAIEFDLYQSTHLRTKRSVNQITDTWDYDVLDIFKFLNGEFYGLIKVGSPAKEFKVMFSTIWADAWLPSSHCAWTELFCLLHTQYDSSKSSSFIPNGTFINMTTSKQSLMGIISTDTFHLPHLSLPNQTFLEATHVSLKPYIQYRSDGIIGLAFPSRSWLDATPFLYNLVQRNLIKSQMFTIYMNRDQTTLRSGKIVIGEKSRKNVYEETLTDLNVVDKSFWKIAVDSVFAVQAKITHPLADKFNAIIDSGTNTITGPFPIIQKLNYLLNAVYLPGLDRFTVNCREYAKLPSVHFMLNGNEFVLESKYYVQRLTIGNIEACFSPFVASDLPNGDWELGGAFLMQFYTEFYMDNSTLKIGQTKF